MIMKIDLWVIRNRVTGKYIVNSGLKEGGFAEAALFRNSEKNVLQSIRRKIKLRAYWIEQGKKFDPVRHANHPWRHMPEIDLVPVHYEVTEQFRPEEIERL